MDLRDIIKISDENRNELPIAAGIPDEYLEYHIREAEECHIKIDENNIMLFHLKS